MPTLLAAARCLASEYSALNGLNKNQRETIEIQNYPLNKFELMIIGRKLYYVLQAAISLAAVISQLIIH